MTNVDEKIEDAIREIGHNLQTKDVIEEQIPDWLRNINLAETSPLHDIQKINLDEVGGNKLSPEQRASKHTELALELAKEKDFGIGKHISVIETPEFGQNTGVVLIKGLTESSVEGLNLTQHEITIKTKNLSEWTRLSPEERVAKFMTEIIPKAKKIVVAINGWDGNEGIWRPYSPILLNPTHEPGSEEKIVGSIMGMNLNKWSIDQGNVQENKKYIADQLTNSPDDTLIIGISTMGGLGGLDKDNPRKLTKEGIITQIFEAIDEIGAEITEAKMKYLESDEYKNKKRNLIQDIHNQLINDDLALYNLSWKEKFLELNTMLDEEDKIAKDRYADYMLSEIVGHSMGGNIALTIWKHAILGQKMDDSYIKYRNESDTRRQEKRAELAKRIQIINETIFTRKDVAQKAGVPFRETLRLDEQYKPIGGVFNKNFLDTLRNNIAANSDVKEFSKISASEIKSRYQLLSILSLMPVVNGNMFDKHPDWLKQIAERIPNWPVTISRDPLIKLITEISKISEKGSKALVEIGDLIRVVGPEVRNYVGKGTPDDELLWAQYLLNLREVLVVAANHNILDDMSPPFLDETIPFVKETDLARMSGFAGSKDNTVFSAYTEGMGEMLSGYFQDRGVPIIQTLEETEHHPQTKDMPKINAEFWGKIIWAERVKLGRQYKIYQSNENWLRDRLVQTR